MTQTQDPRILDIYKLAVEMSDRVSARRVTANAFFVTVQAAIVTAFGIIHDGSGSTRWPLVALCVVGLLSAVIWWLLLARYRDLNNAKLKVIHEIEVDLPIEIFTNEWTHIKGSSTNPNKKRYTELGEVERLAPFAFGLINIVLGAYVTFA